MSAVLRPLPCFMLEDITTEPHAQDISADILRMWLSGYILADILRMWLSGYILQHEEKGRRFGTWKGQKVAVGCDEEI